MNKSIYSVFNDVHRPNLLLTFEPISIRDIETILDRNNLQASTAPARC